MSLGRYLRSTGPRDRSASPIRYRWTLSDGWADGVDERLPGLLPSAARFLREDLAERRVQPPTSGTPRNLAVADRAHGCVITRVRAVIDSLNRPGAGRVHRLGQRLGHGPRRRQCLMRGDLHGRPYAEKLLDDLVAALPGCKRTAAQSARIAAVARGQPGRPALPRVRFCAGLPLAGGRPRNTPRAWHRATPRGSGSTLRRRPAAAVPSTRRPRKSPTVPCLPPGD